MSFPTHSGAWMEVRILLSLSLSVCHSVCLSVSPSLSLSRARVCVLIVVRLAEIRVVVLPAGHCAEDA